MSPLIICYLFPKFFNEENFDVIVFVKFVYETKIVVRFEQY